MWAVRGIRGGPGTASTQPEIGPSPVADAPAEEEKAKKDEKEPAAKKAKVTKKEKKKASKETKGEKKRSRSKSRTKKSPDRGDRDRSERGPALEATSSRTAHTEGRCDEESPRDSRRKREDKRAESEERQIGREVRRDPKRFGLGHVPWPP